MLKLNNNRNRKLNKKLFKIKLILKNKKIKNKNNK